MARPVIVVVEDNRETLEMMDMLLTDAGYRTILQSESSDAYAMIRCTQPDLVILDLRMEYPNDGWVTMDLLRVDPATAHIPVILYSADREFLQSRARLLQANGCKMLAKPFHPADLLAKVEQALGAETLQLAG